MDTKFWGRVLEKRKEREVWSDYWMGEDSGSATTSDHPLLRFLFLSCLLFWVIPPSGSLCSSVVLRSVLSRVIICFKTTRDQKVILLLSYLLLWQIDGCFPAPLTINPLDLKYFHTCLNALWFSLRQHDSPPTSAEANKLCISSNSFFVGLPFKPLRLRGAYDLHDKTLAVQQ
jgi:hypothetical protein